MLFSKIELRHDIELARLAYQMYGNGYRLHQSLWELFKGEDQSRDFLYRRMEDQDWPCFYIVSARPPEDTIGMWNVQIKNYDPQLREGQQLAFSLCANPVITRSAGQDAKPVRHDIVMDAKKHQAAMKNLPLVELIQESGLRWLVPRAAKHGFQVEQARADSYQQHRLGKGKGDPIRFSTLDFNGVLTVIDPKRFRQALYHGIGPAKGFGCGMLLVRPV